MAKRKTILDARKKRKQEIEKLWKQAKDSLSKLSQETIKLAQKGEEEIIRASRLGKLHLEMLDLKRKKDSLCQQIGEKIVELHKENKMDVGGLKTFCSKVDSLESQIRTKKTAASKLRKSKSR